MFLMNYEPIDLTLYYFILLFFYKIMKFAYEDLKFD